MARYSDGVCRLCRRSGEKLFLKGDRCFTPKCAVERRSTPPGKTVSRRRPKLSEYAVRLREKQKAKWIYGLLEKQTRRYFAEAARKPGVTGQYLLQLLERRLDNAVYRLGMADSRVQARQIINHGHIALNGRVTTSASALVKVGDAIGWRANSLKSKYFEARQKEVGKRAIPAWLSQDAATVSGKVISLPKPEDSDTRIDDRLIVEYYSR
ncbi:MAG: 30S ribosomal protein S4 [Chloroflexi bacterium]|nr:30S ribosomal protein S4 [Chloroflexota bacterium]